MLWKARNEEKEIFYHGILIGILKNCSSWAVKSNNGNWLLTKKSDVLVDGKSYRSFVLEHYGKTRLTENLVDKFREDVENGKIEL